MRIAFCGASGTGKTSVMKFVADTYGLEMCPVGSRSTAKAMGFSFSPYDVDKASALRYLESLTSCFEGTMADARDAAAFDAMNEWHEGMETCRLMFQMKLQRDKIHWENGRKRFITDRTSVCDLTYTGLHLGRCGPSTHMVNAAREHVQRYDVVVLFPIDEFHRIDDDPARLDDLDYQRRWEDAAFTMIRAWVSPEHTFTAEAGTVEERAAMVRHAMLVQLTP